MTDRITDLAIQIEPEEGADATELDQITDQLRSELLDLDVEEVQRVSTGEVPEGARAVDVAILGALVVKLGPEAIKQVVRGIQSWLTRSRIARSAELTINGQSIKVTGISPAKQEELINAWLKEIGSP
jgi:hypothetical protein